jgi:hypothetical protein
VGCDNSTRRDFEASSRQDSRYASVSASATRETSENRRISFRTMSRWFRSFQLQNPDATVTDAAVDQTRSFALSRHAIKASARLMVTATSQGSGRFLRSMVMGVVSNGAGIESPHFRMSQPTCWEDGDGSLAHSGARVCGQPRGVSARLHFVTGHLYRSVYLGTIFDCTVAALTRKDRR